MFFMWTNAHFVLEQYVELQPDNYDLYPYQIELIAHAINGKDNRWEQPKIIIVGKNTIICAPTGSGKTMIATELIKKHLIQKEFEKKTGRVIFTSLGIFTRVFLLGYFFISLGIFVFGLMKAE